MLSAVEHQSRIELRLRSFELSLHDTLWTTCSSASRSEDSTDARGVPSVAVAARSRETAVGRQQRLLKRRRRFPSPQRPDTGGPERCEGGTRKLDHQVDPSFAPREEPREQEHREKLGVVDAGRRGTRPSVCRRAFLRIV